MRDAASSRDRAAKCRELATQIDDRQMVANLLLIAKEYEAEAQRLDAEQAPVPPNPVQ